MTRKLTVNISNYVQRLKNIDFLQPLYEAIVNSMDANATSVKIKFCIDNDSEESFVNGFSVLDNGDGFNAKNLDSFFEMMKMDKQKGKLGSGRFIWLKVFDTIQIKSKLENKEININFVKDYNKITEEEETVQNNENLTTISFSNVTSEYLNKRPIYDIDKIQQAIFEQLLPKLLILKQENKFVTIDIDGKRQITNKNLTKINQKTFVVKRNNHESSFTLYYDIKKDKRGLISTYYVAHGRQVRKFTSEAKLPKIPNKTSVIMFLTSDYFNEHIGDDRNDFDIDVVNTSENSPLSFSDINKKLVETINNILNNELPEIKAANIEAKQNAIKQVPHLAKYINDDIESIRSESEWLKYANEEFEKEEKKIKIDFKKILSNKNIPNSEYNRIISDFKRIGEVELGRYIAYRQQIIQHLTNLEQDSSTNEGQLHDVFIEYLNKSVKQNKNKNQTFDNYVDTNLWIVDDKFMFYKNVFSDESIKKIKEKISKETEYYSLNRCEPDITIFYSKLNLDVIDVVVVEFKAISMTSDEARKKAISIEEINTNIGIIKDEIQNVNNFYGFIITRLDDKTSERLIKNDAQKLYSNGDIPYFYIYNKNSNSHTYFVDIRSLIQDANKRNQIFLDILTQKN